MKKSSTKELLEWFSEFLYSLKQIVKPKNISKISIEKKSEDSVLSSNLFNDGQSFMVNDIQISKHDHMRVYPCASNNFIKHKRFCDVCKNPMDTLFCVSGNSGETGLIKSICPSCTYIKFTSVPTDEWYKKFFSDKFYSKEIKNRGIPSEDTTIFDATKKYIKTDSKVFDIGCGFGEKLKPFQGNGFEIFGIEPSRHRADAANKLLNGNVDCLMIEEALQKKSVINKTPFDLCSFFHVLEFFVNPYIVLKNLYPLVAENGIIYIATGLFNTRSIMQESHFGLIPSTFNQYSLGVLLEAVGFEILSSKVVSRGRTLEVIARKNSKSKKFFNNSQKLKQLEIINKHICSELGLNHKERQYKIITSWSGGSKTGAYRKAVLTYIPSKNKENTPIYFIHKNKDPVILVK